MNNVAPKIQKYWAQKLPSKSYKNAITTKFVYSQASTLPKDTLAKFYLSTTFRLRVVICSAARTQ